MAEAGHFFLPSIDSCLTFFTSADQYIKRWQSLAPKSENIYSPSDLILHCLQRMFFSLKISPAVKLIQCCSMEVVVAPCTIDLNVKPGHKVSTHVGTSPCDLSLQLVSRRVYNKGLVAGTCPTNSSHKAI